MALRIYLNYGYAGNDIRNVFDANFKKMKEKKETFQQDKIFLGHTPSEQRKFLVYFLKDLKDKYPKLNVPCVGEFSIVKAAIEAGYDKSMIWTSDISLFSELLGCYFTNVPIENIGFKLSILAQEEYDACTNDNERIAVVMYYMRLHQYRDYEVMRVDEVLTNKEKYTKQLSSKLEQLKATYEGIHYNRIDLRKAIEYNPEMVTIINPPAFAKGYEKMFDFGEDIKFESGIEEFNLNKEFKNMFRQTQDIDAPFLWYGQRGLRGAPAENAIFAKEYPKLEYDYWIINNPKFYTKKKVLVQLGRKNERPIKGLKMFTDEDELKVDSKIQAFVMKEENCMYYRDLWAHKLGVTKAELYIGFLIDGKLFAITGLMLNKARSLQSNELFENFGFSVPSKKYQTINRLLMMLLTSTTTRTFVYAKNRRNQIFRLERFRTTCLSKYRKVKLNNGLLEVEFREKQGQWYKIMYGTNFYERNYNECVKIYLEEIANGREK